MLRRDFIKQGCSLCLAVGGSATLMSLLDSCTPLPVYKTQSVDKKIEVPLIAFAQNNFLIVKPENLNFNVAVVKQSEQEYKSFVMLCTHADNPLQFSGNEFRCNLHGSMFDRNGKVEKGPAEKSLTSLETRLVNNSLIIQL